MNSALDCLMLLLVFHLREVSERSNIGLQSEVERHLHDP